MDGSQVNSSPEASERRSLKAGPAVTSGHSGPPAELDLDRLVWDPEYREAMRHLIARGS